MGDSQTEKKENWEKSEKTLTGLDSRPAGRRAGQVRGVVSFACEISQPPDISTDSDMSMSRGGGVAGCGTKLGSRITIHESEYTN